MSIDTAVTTDVTRNDDVDDYPRPPSLHWALVAVLSVLAGRLFLIIWMYRQAAWVRRIDPSSKALFVLVGAFGATLLAMAAITLGAVGSGLTVTVLLVRLGFAVPCIWSYLSMRQSLEARFDLKLSAIMTIFYPVFYLQYHMTLIAKGEHSPHQDGLCLSAGLRLREREAS